MRIIFKDKDKDKEHTRDRQDKTKDRQDDDKGRGLFLKQHIKKKTIRPRKENQGSRLPKWLTIDKEKCSAVQKS
jgi:hypothetical protein